MEVRRAACVGVAVGGVRVCIVDRVEPVAGFESERVAVKRAVTQRT